MATIKDIYQTALQHGVLSPDVSEEEFVNILNNDQERHEYWEHANKQKPNFYSSDFDLFSKNASALLTQSPTDNRETTAGQQVQQAGVSGGSLLNEQEELTRQNAILGVTNDPNQPFVAPQTTQPIQGRELKMDEVIRPKGYENLTDEQLNEQIAQLSGNVHEQKARELYKARYGKDYVEPEEPKGWWERYFGNKGREYANERQRYAEAVLDASRIEELDNPGAAKRRNEQVATLKQEKAYRDRQVAMPKLGEEIKDLQQRILSNEKQDGNDMRGAKHLLNQTIDLYNAPSKYGRGSGIANWGQGLADQITDYDTWTAGVTELVRYGNLNGIVNKMNKGGYDTLTKAEQLLLETFLMSTAVQDMRSDLSTGYEIGKGAAESIPFMVEMYLTAGAGAAAKRGLVQLAERKVGKAFAEKLARSLGGTAIRDAAGNLVERGATQTVAGKVGKTLAYDFAQTAAMPSTYSNIYKDRVTEILQGDGNYGFNDLARSFTGQMVETGTERWGGRLIDSGMSKMIPIDATALWGKNKLFGHFVENYINSPIGETGEEIIAAGVNTLRSLNPLYYHTDDKSVSSNKHLRGELGEMLTPEGLGKTFLTILPMSIFGGGVNAAMNRMAANAVVRDYGQSRQALQSLLESSGATPEEANRIVNQIEASDSDRAFFDKMNMAYNNLLNKYMMENPNAPIEDVKAYQQQLDQVLGDYTKQAGAYNQMVGDLMEKYEKLSNNEKHTVDSAMEDYMVRSAEEFASKQQQPQDRQTQLRQQAAQQAQQEVQGMAHQDGNVYYVGIKGKDDAEGYAVSGNISIQQDKQGMYSTSGRDLVTVKMNDGSVQQVPADELIVRDIPVSADELMQERIEHYFAQYANNDLFHVGDKVYIKQDGQQSEESSNITAIDDAGIHVEAYDEQTGQTGEIVISHEQAAEKLALAEDEQQTQPGQVVDFTIDGNPLQLYQVGEDTYEERTPDGKTYRYTSADLANMGAIRQTEAFGTSQIEGSGSSQIEEQAPAYPTDETGNPAWGQMEVPQSAQVLYDLYKGNRESAKAYADDQLKEAQRVQKSAAKLASHNLNLAQRLAEEEQNAQFKAQADAAVKYWEDVKLAIAQIKTADELAAEQAQRDKIMAAREQNRKTEEGTTANATMAERYNAAPKIIGNTGTTTLPDGRELSGHYVLISPEGVTASHNAADNFRRSEGYPITSDGQSINDRDYTADQEEQQKVTSIAQNFNGNAIKNMPVISDEGLVYNGNGRMMAGQLAAINGTDAAYMQSLMNNAAQYGFTPEQVASIPNARVVFQLDERLPYSTQSLAIFNEQETQTQSNTGKAAGYARKLTPQAVSDVLSAVDGFNTIDAFFSDKKAPFNLINSLINAGIIAQREKAEMIDGDKLSATGRERLANILFGTVFDNETIRLMGDDAALKNSIMRALPQILDNKSLGEFSLESDINDAIRLLYETRRAGVPFQSFVRQTVMSEDGEVHTAAENYSPYQLLLAEEMIDGGVDAFRDVLNLYNEQANTIQGGQVDIFGDLLDPTELKNLILQRYGKEPNETERPSTGRQNDNAPASAPTSNEPAAEVTNYPQLIFAKNYYKDKGAREVAHGIKEDDLDSIFEAADEMYEALKPYVNDMVNGGGITFIPVPSRKGKADTTFKLASLVSQRITNKTPKWRDGTVTFENILQGNERESLYELKKAGRSIPDGDFFGYRLTGELPQKGTIILVDGVYATGATMDAARKVVGGDAISLVYAYDDTKAAEVTPEERLAKAEAETDTNPTEAQKKAENYKQGHVTLWGLPITIENPKGSIRRGTDANGKQWEQEMHHTYGKIRRTEGVDGDHIDVFIGPNLYSDKVFVVDQRNVDTGEFDEHKCMLGFDSLADAQNGYLSNYEEGWQGMGTVTEVTMDEFKKWIDSSTRKTKPFAEYKSVKAEGAASTAMDSGEQLRDELAVELRKLDYEEPSPIDANVLYDIDDLRNAVTEILTRYNNPALQSAIDAINNALAEQRARGVEWVNVEKEEEDALVQIIRDIVGDKAAPIPTTPKVSVGTTPLTRMSKDEILNELQRYAAGNLFDMSPRMAKRIISLAKKYGKGLPEEFENMASNAKYMTELANKKPKAQTKEEGLTPLETTKAAEPKNTIFTDEAYEKAKARMKARLNRLNMGIDPEMVADQIVIAGYHVERGARKFADFARALIADFGDGIRQYARQMYNYLRDIPEGEPFRAEMDDYATVMAFDIDNFDFKDRMMPAVREYEDVNGQKIVIDDVVKGRDGTVYYELTITEPSGHIRQTSLSVDNFNKELESKGIFPVQNGTEIAQGTINEENNVNNSPENLQELEKNTTFAGENTNDNEERLSENQSGVAGSNRLQQGGLAGGETTPRADAHSIAERLVGKSSDEQHKIAQQWAQENGVLFNIFDLVKQNNLLPFKGGNENDNWVDTNQGVIYKMNNLINSAGKISNLFESVELYNQIFTDTPLTFYGFSMLGSGIAYPVYTQRFIPNGRVATIEEINSHMHDRGFEPTGKEGEFTNGAYVVGDVRPRNVLVREDGGIFVIDADVKRAGQGRDGKKTTFEKGQKVKYKQWDAVVEGVNSDGTYNLSYPNMLGINTQLIGISEKDIKSITSEQPKLERPESPMMKQFKGIKEQYPDAVLLFRVGDFYELYDTDAEEGSKILGITLAKNHWGKMAGFPFHALDTYLPKLVRAGKRVAICDQLKNPKDKPARRGVTEQITPKVENAEVAEPESVTDNQEPTIQEPNIVTDTVGEITESKHTKTGNPIWVVKPLERVGNDEFRALRKRAKENNGYYSTFVKGYVFNSVNDANRFNNISDVQTTTEQGRADSEAAISTAETANAEAAAIRRDSGDTSGAAGELGGESVETGLSGGRNVELTPDQAAEQTQERKDAIQKIDEATERIDKQLAELTDQVEEETPEEEPAPTSMSEVVEQAKKRQQKAKQRKQKLEQTLDLFAEAEDSTPALDEQTEPINNKDNGSTEVRNDGERESSTPQGRTAGQPTDQNGTLGGSQRQTNEGTQSGGVGSRSEQHRVHDGERGLGTAGQRSTESVEEPVAESERKNTHNFRYDPSDPAPTSNKARYEANLAAIRLLKQLQDEGRQATPEEQRILAKFTGWGGLGEFFKGEPGTTYYVQNGEKSPYQVIKELLTDEEMQAAQLSRNSAYFTPPAIIDELWNVAKHLGFKGGNILEGSAGIGNILSQMPQSISDRSNLQAVEIDSITAGVLAQLYPDAQVHAAGFQEVDIPNNSQDLVITNVPFVTGLRVYDKKEKDLSKRFGNIHDFCIAKNIRKLRQGGIGIFITTSGTLDSSKDLRRWLNNEGETDVIGAFRLNRETFGGTSATSDIIVVRKRVNGQKDPRAIDVLDTDVARVAETEEDGKNIEKKLIYNRYFVEHPESMGGEMGFGFEHGDTRWGGTTAGCYPSSAINQSERLQEWVETIPTTGDVQTVTVRESNNINPGTYEEYHGDLPYGSLVLNSKDEICRVYNGMVVPVVGINPTKVKGHTKAEVVKDYNTLKAAVEELLAEQAKGISDEGLKGLLKKLNHAYDDFVKKYGNLNRNVSLSFLRNDVQWASIAALENVRETIDKSGKKHIDVSKTDVFSKRVVGVQAEPKAENARDGVILSVQQYGNVRPDMIAMWLERPQEEVEKEIIESRLAFRDPQTGNMVVSHEYLSGNVREKLAYAEEHNENGIYDTNIEELRKVIPVDIPAHLIEFNIGSTWIPVELYHQYLKEKFSVDNLQLVHVGSAWISNEKSYGGYALRNEKNRAEGVYSEKLMEQVYGHQLMIAAMNNVPVVVSKVQKNYDGTTETITDKAATAACSDKISQIKDDFVEWARGKMQEDSELAERVQKIYNERFNAIVPMLSVDKAFLSPHLPGQNHKYTLYDHQQQAVVRATTQPVMLAHEVGTGKTITLISSAMEMRRLGTAKKPMIVVQNATTPQFVKEAKDLYPNAKILTVSERDRTKEGRQEFYAKIKYNDWDLIIVPQSVFDMIPDSESRMRDFIQEKIDEKMHAIEAAKEANVDAKVTKRMEKELEALQEDLQNANMSGKRSKSKTEKDAKKDAERIENAKARAEEMLDRRTDEVEDFDDMGIDALLIDEAHNYKHLGFATMMTRGVKGIDPSYSKRAAALYLKCQSVYERCGHRNVVFATGTPISNTAAEIWTFMKYLMPKEVLKDNDIYYFDDFVHNFGKIAEQLEFTTNGKFKANNRFAQYGNVPELMRIWLTCADCVLTREVGQVNDKVPELEGGKAQDIFLPQSPSLIDIMTSVRAELERYEQMSGKEKKENSHIPLTMYGVAKRAAIDPRLVDASAADEPLSKTNKAVEETLRSLKETKKYNGTVAIFCDSYRNLQTGFNLFEDIKAKLVKGGVPAAKIAIIRSEMTDAAKQKIFDAVREGEIRVIMGSTQTLGTGVNIQTRLHTLIHMDAPDRPMDYTQRNGRIIRQGNMHRQWNLPVRVLRFGVEDSLDVTSYQRLKTKAGFIDSIMNGKSMIDNNLENRVLEDVEEGIFDNPVAMLSGSQYALLKSQAERDLRKWQARKQQHDIDQILIAKKLKDNAQIIERRRQLITTDEKFLQILKQTFPTGKVTEYNIDGTICHNATELKEALKATNADIQARADKLRKEGYEGSKQNIAVSLQFNGMLFNVNIVLVYNSRWESGQRAITINKEVQYTTPTSDHWLASPTKVLDKLIEHIEQDYLSGTAATSEINYSRSYIERLQQENELMRQREGKPFEHSAELEKAQALVDEYTEKMQDELAEKEAKYANMSSGRAVTFNEQDDENETTSEAQITNLDYPQFANQTEAQQLATAALVEVLNDNTDLDVFLATDEEAQEIQTNTGEIKNNTPELSFRTDRDGNPIGDGDWHMNYFVREFPEYPQISSRVDKSVTTESVYVTYTNADNGRSVKVRFSGHRSNAERFGDVLTGSAPRGEILYRLGLATKEWQPFGYVPIGTISNKQIAEGNYEVADKTRAELERLPKGTDISEYKGKLVPGEPNRIYTGTFVGESQSAGIYIYKDANGNEIRGGLREAMLTPNGTLYGWAIGDRIYLTKAGLNPNTPIHEYTHLWAKAMMRNNREGWQSIVDIFKDTEFWNEVVNDPNYQGLTTDDAICSEVLARYSGQRGAAHMEQWAQEELADADYNDDLLRGAQVRRLIKRAKQAIEDFWHWVGTNLFGIKHFDSAEQVADRVLFDMLNGTNLQSNEDSQYSKVATDAWNKYQYDGELESVRDVAEYIEENMPKDEVTAPLFNAIDKYRSEEEEDRLYYGERGDLEPFEDAIFAEIEKLMTSANDTGSVEMMMSGYTPEKQRIINEWYAAHPYPQYQLGETFDHYAARLDAWKEEFNKLQLKDTRPSINAATKKSNRSISAGASFFVPGVRPTPLADETPGEYALRLRQYYQLMRDERLVAEYVAEINNQADAAAKVLKKNTIVRGLLDAAKPIENFQEWMKQHGATITDESNAYTDTFLATGRVTEANEQMQRDIIRPLAKQIAKIIAPTKETGKSRLDGINIVWHNMDIAGTGTKLDGKALTPREIIGVYCQAKDCAEAIEKGLPDRGAKGFLNNLGMSHDDIITAVESVIPRAELDELWRLINTATHFALNYDYESGRISEDTHIEFYQREFYVPQRGWRERDESGLITEYEPVGKRGNDPYNAALVKAHGRQSLASDPFAYIMSIDASSIVSSENNKIKQKFLQFCLDNENLGLQTGAFRVKKYWIMNVINPETGKIKLDEEGNPMMEVSYVAPSAEDLSHDRTIKELIKKKRKEWAKVNQAYLERQSHGELGPQLEVAYKTKLNKIEQAIEDLEQQMHIAWNATNTNITQRTSDEKKQHEVRVLLDGQEYLIEVQDEKLANAINKKFKQHQEQLFNTSQKMRNATRFMSAVLTQYNPEFAVSNFARDFQVALATLTAEHPELVGPFLKNFAACQPAVWKYAFNDKVRDRAVFRDSELGRYLQEYFKAGAATGFSYMQDLKTLRQDFDAMINESNLRRGIKGAVGTLSMLTQVSETAVRFAGYVAARQKGMGINEAAYLSKELTTNFDRAGEVADSGWMSWFSFFRATLNGNIKFLKALKKMPVAYSIIAAAYVAMGMLNQFLNPDDPEDGVWAGDFTRESNFVIGKWRIPTAHFLRMFFAAGVNAAKWMQGEKSFGEATYNTANFVSQELLPNYLNLFGNGTEWNSREGKVDFTWEGLLQGVMPSPVSPIADVYFNRDFRGATINREPFVKSQEGTKDILLSKENTLPVYKWLTQAIYEGVGGNMNAKYQSDDPAWRSWLFDTSASSVEHVVEGYMPAGMDMFITLGEAIYDAATGTPTGPDKWPFVRKFYNAYTPERAYMQQYYLLNGRVKEFKRNMDDYRKNDLQKYRRVQNSQEYRIYQAAERLVKNQIENPTTADIKALINANKQWIKYQ